MTQLILAVTLQALWQCHVKVTFSSAAAERAARHHFCRTQQVRAVVS